MLYPSRSKIVFYLQKPKSTRTVKRSLTSVRWVRRAWAVRRRHFTGIASVEYLPIVPIQIIDFWWESQLNKFALLVTMPLLMWTDWVSPEISGFATLSWWRHQMETFSALLALCALNSPVTGEFPAQRPVMRNVGVLFDLCPNKGLSKQSWGWWFETPSCPLWRHCNVKWRADACVSREVCITYVTYGDVIMPSVSSRLREIESWFHTSIWCYIEHWSFLFSFDEQKLIKP